MHPDMLLFDVVRPILAEEQAGRFTYLPHRYVSEIIEGLSSWYASGGWLGCWQPVIGPARREDLVMLGRR
jgi:hypothetical protein